MILTNEREVIKMENIKIIEKEIEQRKNSIKEMEEELKKARKELRKFDKYRGLKFDSYKEYHEEIYRDGLAKESFINVLRSLVLHMAGYEDKGGYLDFRIKKSSELNIEEIKLCNDFLDEIYPIISKYMDSFIECKSEVI